MDESAVSSDPVIAFLLDEVVVKDWCKRAFKNIIEQVRGICIRPAYVFLAMLFVVSIFLLLYFFDFCLFTNLSPALSVS